MRPSPRSSLRSANIFGGLIQLSQVAGALVFNLVLPRLLGARDFGLAAAALALPYAVSGAIERPVWSALQAGAPEKVEDAARRLSANMFLLMVLIVFAALALTPTMRAHGMAWASGPLPIAALALLPMAVAIVSLGAAYAASRPENVLYANVLHALVLILGSVGLALLGFGAMSPALGLLLAQLSMLLILALRRALVVPALAGARWMSRGELRAMALTLPVQLPMVVVASLAVPAMAGWLGLEGAAQYRVAVGLLLAAATATPISPAVVQMTVGELAARPAPDDLRRYLTRLLGACALFGVLWMAFFLVPAPPLLGWLLGGEYSGVTGAMEWIGAGCLPWLAVTLSVSVLLGLGAHGRVAVLSASTAVGCALVLAATALLTRDLGATLLALVVMLWLAALGHAALVLRLLGSRESPQE